jgi:hypothetical protein
MTEGLTRRDQASIVIVDGKAEGGAGRRVSRRGVLKAGFWGSLGALVVGAGARPAQQLLSAGCDGVWGASVGEGA